MKIAIICVILLGAVVPAVGTYRLVFPYQTLSGPPPPDPTCSISLTSSVVECKLAIATASAPALRGPGLFRCWLPQLFSSSKPTWAATAPTTIASRSFRKILGRGSSSTSISGGHHERCRQCCRYCGGFWTFEESDQRRSDDSWPGRHGYLGAKAPIGTGKDNRTALVIIGPEDDGSWAHAMENDPWGRRSDELRYSASPAWTEVHMSRGRLKQPMQHSQRCAAQNIPEMRAAIW